MKEQSHIEPNGNYAWGSGVRISVKAKVPDRVPELERDYVIFERKGREWKHVDGVLDGLDIPVIPWRDVPISDAWRRYTDVQDNGDESDTG